MPTTVLKEFTEQVVRKDGETIHEIEEESGSIELWHEGVLVDKLTSYTGVEYALREAPAVAKGFRITPSSSLHVRVRAERTRGLAPVPASFDTVNGSTARPSKRLTVLRRHVWDSHAGDLAEGRTIALPFLQSAFYAAPGARPEFVSGDGTVGMTVRQIEWLPEQLLWEGWGFGCVADVSMERIDLDARPAHIENDRSLGSPGAWTQFRFSGVFGVTVPPGIDERRALELLGEHGCEPRVSMTRRSWPEWTKGGHLYCGSPATVHSWGSGKGAVMTVFFSADHHFGHPGIIRNAGRPFANVAEMDEVLIANWNARIRSDSIVYYVGDFAHKCPPERLRAIWARLSKPKAIHLVPGNHDDEATLQLPWTSIERGILTMSASNRRFSLFHYAMRTWPGFHRNAIHAFGHSHNRMPGFRNTLDVGVDAWGFAPASVDDVIRRADELPPLPYGEEGQDAEDEAAESGS